MAQIIVHSTMLKMSKLALKATGPMVLRSSTYSTEPKKTKIKKHVFISQSSDIFTNLALEDWMYRNMDFTKRHVLLLWRNDPCVVIGRHQNPWLEANLSGGDFKLARRNSGGGTVYHDRGNLNLTFFSPRGLYNRKNNLELISRALYREWHLETDITKREDIVVLGDQKISGTASKLGRPNAYHHCTLLVDVNKTNLSKALQKKETGITTNATRSVPSPVLNLNEVNPNVKIEKLLGAVGWEYLRTDPFTQEDGGQELISKQNGFTLINPVEYYFPGVEAIRNQFVSWDWRFGKSPKFNVSRSFSAPRLADSSSKQELAVSLQITKGMVEDATIKIPSGLMPADGFEFDTNITNLRGSKFSEEAMSSLEKSLTQATAKPRKEFATETVRQVVKNV